MNDAQRLQVNMGKDCDSFVLVDRTYVMGSEAGFSAVFPIF